MTAVPDLKICLAEAASVHGHTCPSLVYGCRLALLLLARLPSGTAPAAVVLRHTSSCFRDGAAAALSLGGLGTEPRSERRPDGCSIEAVWPGGRLRLGVRKDVREAVDVLKDGRDLVSFRAAGVGLLLGLTDDAFAEVIPA